MRIPGPPPLISIGAGGGKLTVLPVTRRRKRASRRKGLSGLSKGTSVTRFSACPSLRDGWRDGKTGTGDGLAWCRRTRRVMPASAHSAPERHPIDVPGLFFHPWLSGRM